jgi:hypothetical protein
MRRPHGIVILTCVLAAGGIAFLLGADALLLSNQLGVSQSTLVAAGVRRDAQTSTGLLALAGGVVQLALAIGLFQLRRWAWGAGVVVMGTTVGLYGVALHNKAPLAQDKVVTFVAAALILLYLLAPGVVRAFFGKSAKAGGITEIHVVA